MIENAATRTLSDIEELHRLRKQDEDYKRERSGIFGTSGFPSGPAPSPITTTPFPISKGNEAGPSSCSCQCRRIEEVTASQKPTGKDEGELNWESFMQGPSQMPGPTVLPPFPTANTGIDSANLPQTTSVKPSFLNIDTGNRYRDFMTPPAHAMQTSGNGSGYADGGENSGGGEWSMLNQASCFGSSMPWQRERESSLNWQTPFHQQMPWQHRSEEHARWPPTLSAPPNPYVTPPLSASMLRPQAPAMHPEYQPCYGGYFAPEFNPCLLYTSDAADE